MTRDANTNESSIESNSVSSHPGRRPFLGSFRSRILTGMAVMALCPLLVLAWQGYNFTRQEIVAQQEKHLRTVLESRKARLTDWLDERRAELRFLASTPCARKSCPSCSTEPGPQGCQCEIIKTFREQSTPYEVITTFDPEWHPIDQSNITGSDMKVLVDNAFAARLAEAKDLVVNPPGLLLCGTICLEMGHPLIDNQAGRVGYLVACVNLSRAIDPILQDRTGLGETGKVFLVSPEAQIQSQPLASDDLIGRKSGHPRAARSASPASAQPPTAVVEYNDHTGAAVLGAVTDFPGMPFSIIAEIDQAEAFESLRSLEFRVLITVIVTLAAALLLSLRIAGRLSFPLRELAAVARRISKGSLGERLGPMDETEAREVASAFNRMLDELAAAQRRLSHAAALAAIGELSTSVVHEVRNPLSSIKVNIQALRKKVEGDDAHTELAEIAERQVDRVARMLNDLLQYGKPLDLNPAPVAFSDLLGDVLEVVGEKANRNGVSLKVDDGADGTLLVVDREQMGRALINLVTNAIEAVADSGEGEVTVSGRPSTGLPGAFAITVVDNGPGIPDSIMGKVFQPFVTTRDLGTGLGLANVKKIAEYHGGGVTAKNCEPGAVFELTFPVRP